MATAARWASALRDCVRADLDARALGFPWLELQLPPAGDAAPHWERELRRALRLLGLLAFKDHARWKRLLIEAVDVDASDARAFQDAEVAPRFLLLLDVDSGAEVLRRCARLLQGEEDDEDGEFTRAYEEIEALPVDRSTGFGWRAARRSHKRPKVDVCVEFAPCFVGRGDGLAYLTSVRDAVATIKQRAEEEGCWFRLDSIRLATNSIELTAEMADVLANLLRLGVTVAMMSFTLEESGMHARMEKREALGSILMQLTSIEQQGQALVDRVSLLALRANVHQFAAFMSALTETTFANAVDLIMDEECSTTRRFKWKWVAFSVFHPGATIRKVEIYDQLLLQDDVDAMRELLESADPGPQLNSPQYAPSLAAFPRDQQDQFVYYVHVKAGSRISLEPVRNVVGWVGKTIQTRQPMRLRAMVYDELIFHVEVMVPGYGQCWVYFPDIVTVEKLDRSSISAQNGSSISHQVTSLTMGLLGSTVRDPLALRSFMNLVGAPLQYLSLYQKEPISQPEVAAILQSCPKLKHLKLHNVELDMDLFIEAYQNRGSSISTLELESYSASAESIHRFASLLSTVSNPVAATLRRLYLKNPIDLDGINDRCLQAFHRALQQNRRMECLELHVDSALYERYEPLLAHHNGEILDVIASELPVECKAALISAVYAVEERLEAQGLAYERVLTPIFEFAATRATRAVLLREN